MMATATPYQSLSKIPGQVGYMVLNEDGAVLLSSGDLQNEEKIAKTFYKMSNLVRASQMEPLKRITVNFDSHFYAVSSSGKKLVIVKRHSQSKWNQSDACDSITLVT